MFFPKCSRTPVVIVYTGIRMFCYECSESHICDLAP
uniref:Uncharacterized protein n=1 Tax=Anguilla anguilla TaxID=7936 RepID=A0A0E9U9C0_ANGAN